MHRSDWMPTCLGSHARVNRGDFPFSLAMGAGCQVQASVSANTYVITGHAENKRMEDRAVATHMCTFKFPRGQTS